MAAVLAGGSGAVLSHSSAAALWRLRDSEARVEITVPGHGWRPQPGIRIHSSRTLEPEDRRNLERIPVTSVSRTLLDLAETLNHQALHRAFEQAEVERLLDMRDLGRVYERNHGRHGLRGLRLLITSSRSPEPAARSELERRFLDLCHDERLPMPSVNALVAGFEVDMAWPEEGLIVELDGHRYHGTRRAFERDRSRDAALQALGYFVVRITYRRLATEPARIADEIRRLLLRGRSYRRIATVSAST